MKAVRLEQIRTNACHKCPSLRRCPHIQAERGLIINGICKPADSSPLTRGLITILVSAPIPTTHSVAPSSPVNHTMTHSDFFSNSGFEANCSNVKFLKSTNNIALISTKANLYPIQFLGPPRKVSMLPNTPGTELRASCCSLEGVRAYRSGLKVSASGPQIWVEALILWIAVVS